MSAGAANPMRTAFSAFDHAAMRRALELAALGLDSTHPNPRVGCVVAQGERIVGEGWHQRAGQPHAESRALVAAGEAARGATVYVTLEPCSHHGRTPPCVDALVAARVARVVFAQRDPNPRVDGRGAARLREAGIRVDEGLLEQDAAALNAGFLQRMRAGRPLVRVKLAASLDGRTALANGASQWITSDTARLDVQGWRARSSAVLTGSGTVLADDPRLDVRLPGPDRRQPLRVVLDSQLRTPPAARILQPPGEVLVLAAGDDASRRAALEARGARVEILAGEGGRLALAPLLQRLGQLEMNEVLVEAGPTLAGAFVREGLADELLVYVAPCLLGPDARALLDLPVITALSDAPRFEFADVSPVGTDLRLRLKPLRRT